MFKSLFSKLSVILFLISFITVHPQTDFMQLKLKDVGINFSPGKSKIICDNFDNSGKEKILFDFNNGRYFGMMDYFNGDYKFSWISPLYENDQIQAIKHYDIDNDSKKEIFVLHTSGVIDIFNPVDMSIDSTLNTSINNSISLNISDVDNDGVAEYVIGQMNGIYSDYMNLYILNSKTLEQEWDTTNIAVDKYDIQTGNVDDDDNDEIIISSGLVLDGKTHKVEWYYSQGFGTKIKLADLDSSGSQKILSLSNYYDINVFDAINKTPLWSIHSNDDLQALYVDDIDKDGDNEIIVGNDQWGSISCYSATDRKLKWSIKNPNVGTMNITTGDPNNDGEVEVVFSAGEGTSGPDFLYIGNIVSEEIEWQNRNLNGPFHIGISDVNADKINEIVGSSYQSDNGYANGKIFSIDPFNTMIKIYYEIQQSFYNQVNCMATGNINDTEQSEVLIGEFENLNIFDLKNKQSLLREQIAISTGIVNRIKSIVTGDVDKDGDIEIVIGDEDGYIYILNSNTYKEEWHSIQNSYNINKLELINCDDDDALEIVACCYQNSLIIYDGKTHYLEWQSNPIYDLTTFDVADLNRDGKKEIVYGTKTGEIYSIDCLSHNVIDTLNLIGEPISGIKIANLDMDSSNEIIIGSTNISIYDFDKSTWKFKSEQLGNTTGFGSNLIVTDIDNDHHMDVFTSNDNGIFQFRCNDTYPDITPPVVLSTEPLQNDIKVSLNKNIKINFSEELDENTITNNNIYILADDSLELKANIVYSPGNRSLEINPDTLLPADSKIKINLSAEITDLSLNGLDGNNNGISNGSPDDDFILSFQTGSYIDTVGPTFMNVKMNKEELWPGFDLNVSASITDSSEISISKIRKAECFIDSIGVPGTGTELIPIDENFDSSFEDVILSLNITFLKAGKHKLILLAEDIYGNWGKQYDLQFTILEKDKNDNNWPMIYQNPQNTGCNEKDSILVPLIFKWEKKIFDNPVNKIIAVDNQLFVTENNDQTESKVKALNIDTGDTTWTYQIGYCNKVRVPGYYKGRLFVPVNENPYGGGIVAIDAMNGEFLWKYYYYNWNDSIGIAPIIAEDKIFIAAEGGKLTAINALNNIKLWSSVISSEQFSWVPAYNNGFVYTCGQDQSYSAFTTDSGSIVSYKGISGIGKTSVINNNILFTQNPINAINLDSKNNLWSNSSVFVPAIKDGKVYCLNSNQLMVNEETTGDLLWSYSSTSKFINSPTLTTEFIFLSSKDSIFAINIKSHKKEWQYPKGGELTVANNKLFIAGSDGRVTCLEEGPVSVDRKSDGIPNRFSLMQNFPNPFNPSTTIKFALPEKSHVKLEIFNQLGQLVETLINTDKEPGYHKIVWDASRYSSGVYFYRIKANDFMMTKKLILLK